MRKTKEEAAITREQLLKQALRVFSRKGYAATTLEDIARAAEVTRGAIYWHFSGGKADLYATLLQEYGGRAGVIVQEAAAEGGSLDEILRRVFVRQLQIVEADPEMRAFMELALFKTGPVPELAASRRQQVEAGLALTAGLAGIMAQGSQQGLLRADVDPHTLARAYLAYQNGLIQLWLSAPAEFSLHAQAETLADILMAGLRPQP